MHPLEDNMLQADEPHTLECVTCGIVFNSAWILCQHCQILHKMSLYKIIDMKKHSNAFAGDFDADHASKMTNAVRESHIMKGSRRRKQSDPQNLPANMNSKIKRKISEEKDGVDNDGDDYSEPELNKVQYTADLDQQDQASPRQKFVPKIFKQHMCDHCDKNFPSGAHLRRHQRTHTGERPFRCNYCGKRFTTKGTCTDHVRIHTGEKPHKCRFCSQCFTQHCQLSRHMRKHGIKVKRPHVCTECGKAFSQISYLKDHVKIHSGEKNFKCDVCDKRFIQGSNLRRHERTHMEENLSLFQDNKCEHCEEKFDVISDLVEHTLARHPDVQTHKCAQCNKTYAFQNQLQTHIRVIHTTKKKSSHRCLICDKTFTSKSYLQVHERSHSGEKPFACDICGKTFIMNSHLSEHVKRHIGDKVYKCDQCEKTFAVRCDLRQHAQFHSKVKEFTCECCGKLFVSSASLKRHSLLHSNVKPYHCMQCGKQFVQLGHYQSHTRRHLGEKPYQCEVCGKQFKDKCTLKRHNIESHLEADVHYPCDFCGKLFGRKNNLKRHIARLHTALDKLHNQLAEIPRDSSFPMADMLPLDRHQYAFNMQNQSMDMQIPRNNMEQGYAEHVPSINMLQVPCSQSQDVILNCRTLPI